MSELGLIEGNLTSVHQRNFLLVKLKPYLEDAPFATIETAWKRPYCAPERFWRCYGTLEITDIWLSESWSWGDKIYTVIVSYTKTAVAWVRITLLKYSLGPESELRPSKCETWFQISYSWLSLYNRHEQRDCTPVLTLLDLVTSLTHFISMHNAPILNCTMI